MKQYIQGHMKEMKFIGGRGYVVGQNEIHYPTLILYFLCHDPLIIIVRATEI